MEIQETHRKSDVSASSREVWKISTWVMDHFTITFLARTLNIVARYFTYGF